jgi:hypothetical protein
MDRLNKIRENKYGFKSMDGTHTMRPLENASLGRGKKINTVSA